jgi:thiol:disulfide interchange protein DsbD
LSGGSAGEGPGGGLAEGGHISEHHEQMMKRVALAAAGLLLIEGLVSAQTNPVKFALRLAPGTAALGPGTTFRVRLTAKIDEGWHLYSITQPPGGPIATRISVPKGQPVTLAGTIDAPRPRVAFDQNFGMNIELYDREVTFVVPLKLATDARSGTQRIAVEAYFQACNDMACLRPKTVRTELEITVKGVGSASTKSQSKPASARTSGISGAGSVTIVPGSGARLFSLVWRQ